MNTAVRKKLKTKDEDTVMLLREIDKNPQITQRELSLRMGISLGKVNLLIKVLVKKGLLHTRSVKNARNKISYLYGLTQDGMEEKAKITDRYLKIKMSEYEKLKKDIRQLKQEVMSGDALKKVQR